MKASVLVLAFAACSDVSDDGTPWQDIATLAGSELGPLPTLRAAPGCLVRVASWNLHLFPDPDDVIARFTAASEIAKADVVLLQETSRYPDEELSRSARFAAAIGMTWAHEPVFKLPDGVVQGNAILSRFPLENVTVKRLPHVAQLVHPQDRFAIAADLVVGERRVRIVDVHLDTRISITDRIRQLDAVASDLDERAVVGGDFNTLPWQWVESAVPLTSTEAVIGQRQAAVLDDYMGSRDFVGSIAPDTNTFTNIAFNMRLDNLYTRSVTAIGADVEHVDGSDHYPIWIDLDLCD